MQQTMHRCPDCGGGPVKPLKWRNRGADGAQAIETRCSNCGHVERIDRAKLRW